MTNIAALSAARIVIAAQKPRPVALLAIAIWQALDKPEQRAAFLAALYDGEDSMKAGK